jgi:2-oxoglutarate ferredoxin oxidoreductase subunit alpha
VISWGSNEGAIVEAMEYLTGAGIDVRFISVPYVHPRPDLTAAIEAADEVIVVECNATGQFADVIEHDTLTRVRRINKYDGVRFKADELATAIRETLDADPATDGEEVTA